MFTLQAVLDETRVTLTVAPLWLFYALAALSVLGAALSLRKASGATIAIAVPLSVVTAVAVFGLTHGWINLVFGPGDRSFVRHFRAVFLAVGALSSCAALAVVCAVIALLGALRRSDFSSRVPAVIALVFSVLCGLFAASMVRSIGAPNAIVPRLGLATSGRGQRGIEHTVRVRFEYPESRSWLFTRPSVLISDAQLAAMHARCDECSHVVSAEVPGVVQAHLRGALRGYWFERAVQFVVEDDRGDPRFPLQAGARWRFRDRIDSTTRAGGWAVAMGEGARSLVPRDVAVRRLGELRAELRVERSYVSDGVRLWSVVFERGTNRETYEVFTMGGQTFITRDPEHPRAAQSPWFRDSARPVTLPSGLVACPSQFVPFSLCGDGTAPRIPAGPAGGFISDRSGTGLFVAAITLGAVVPGSGPRTSWCLDGYDSGSGDVLARPSTAPDAQGDRSSREAELAVLCATSAPAIERTTNQETPARTDRSRTTSTRASTRRRAVPPSREIANPF